MSTREDEILNKQTQAQKEQAEHARATEAALQQAQQGAINLQGLAGNSIIEEIAKPDIDGEGDDLEDNFSAEFGRHAVLANIDKKEWERQVLLDRMRSSLAKTEYPREGRIGSKCTGRVRELMTQADEPARPILTDEMSREIDAAFDDLTNARSLGIDGLGFRNITEAIVETRSSSDSGDGASEGGILKRTAGKLFG